MKKLTWGIENSEQGAVWLHEGNEPIRPLEFDSWQAAADWLAENFQSLRERSYYIFAIVSEAAE